MVSELVLPKRFEGLASEPLISALLDEGDTSVNLPHPSTREDFGAERRSLTSPSAEDKDKAPDAQPKANPKPPSES